MRRRGAMANVQKAYTKVIEGRGSVSFRDLQRLLITLGFSPGPHIREPPYLPASRCVAPYQYSACGERCKAVSNTPASGYDKGVWIETRRLTREPLLDHRILVRRRRHLDRRRSGLEVLLRFRRDTRRGGCRVARGHGCLAGGGPRSRASNSPGALSAASRSCRIALGVSTHEPR
jgi:hypothetical protein